MPGRQMKPSSRMLLYGTAIRGGQVFEKCVELGKFDPGLLDANYWHVRGRGQLRQLSHGVCGRVYERCAPRLLYFLLREVDA
jgi:hypothetical protein